MQNADPVIMNDWDTYAQEQLSELQAQDLKRHLQVVDSPAATVIERNSRQLLNFAGNNYLGLANHPEVIAAAQQAAEQWGVGSGASPLVIGRQRIHAELEQALANFKMTDASLLFPTGFAANLGAITALTGRGDFIFADRLNHASLIDACRLSEARTRYWPHDDLDRLKKLLQRCPTTGRRLIATDGVFSMDGDIADVPRLYNLAQEFGALLMIDDAHATGMLGANGRGTLEHFSLDHQGVVQIGTLSKALGAAGGFVCGSRLLIELILNRARSYIYSTAQAPPIAAAALAALNVVQSEPELRQRQLAHVARLHRELNEMGWRLYGNPDAPLLAVHVGNTAAALEVAQSLEAQGILAPAIRPPTVSSTSARIRISPMSEHNDEQIKTLIEAFALLKVV